MDMRRLLCGLLVVGMVVVGCGGDEAASDDSEAATTTSADFDVLFDGEECTVTGPTSVPAGAYTFVLTNSSELEGVQLFVDVYVDGRTWADSENYIAEAGGDGANISQPAWVRGAMFDFGAPALTLSDNQTQIDHVLEFGPHGIMVEGAGIWGCAGLDVT